MVEPTPEQLAQCFYFSLEDRALLLKETKPHNLLGMGIQLGTLRFLGSFLPDPTDVPRVVMQTVASQFGITDLRILGTYLKRRQTKFNHQSRLREYLGLKTFDALETLHLLRFVYARLLVFDERQGVLVDLCTRELAQCNVVLPGATTIERLVTRVRERVNMRLYRDLAKRLNKTQATQLEDLLVVPKDERKTPLERLRQQPDRISSNALNSTLERIDKIKAVGVSKIDLEDIPDSRLTSLAKYAQVAWAQHLAKLSRIRCRATLLVYMQHLEKSATDDALEVFDALMTSLKLRSERKRRIERLRSIADLDASAIVGRDVMQEFLDLNISDGQLRKSIFNKFGEEQLLEAIATITELTSPAEEVEAEIWTYAISTVGRFITPLLSTIEFDATTKAKPLLEGIRWLLKTKGKARGTWSAIPKEFVPQTWRSLVFEKLGKSTFRKHKDQIDEADSLNRPMYAVCLAQQLFLALKRREVFVLKSHKYSDPRIKLLQGEDWESKRGDVCRSLGLSKTSSVEIQKLSAELAASYQNILEQHRLEPCIVLEPHPKYPKKYLPVVPALEGIPETATYQTLERRLDERLPEIDLSELLLEVNAATGFCEDMSLLSEGQSMLEKKDLAMSICAVLVAQACNIGLHAVSQPSHQSLSIGRLAWVQQNYVRADTLLKANARLVNTHTKLTLVQHWGGGEVASADGLRFVVPIRNVFSGANSKYFGAGRGITYYSLISDQYTQLHYSVIPGTLRDSLYLVSLLLEQQTSSQPQEIMTDTAGYSDVVFGLCRLLGFHFSPRIKDIGSLRYWRIDMKAEYGILRDVHHGKIKLDLVAKHWDDVLRVVGSLKLGVVKATEIMRVLAKNGSLSELGQAIAEIGRVEKTKYLLEYISSEALRRRVHAQLSRGELRNSVGREVYHGNRGAMREKYKEGMESQLGALGFVVNAITFWNTRYMQAALGLLEAMGHDVLEADIARLSPLKWRHINFLGRYYFELHPDVVDGDLRPLRDPNAVDPFELLFPR